MALPILVSMPTVIRSGETLKYTRSLPDYPANVSGNSLAVFLRGIGTQDAAVSTNANGIDYDVLVTAAQTAALAPGNYSWIERITATGGVVKDVATGILCILQNLQLAAAGDAQTLNEKLLAVVEAKLSGRITDDMETLSIAGRAIARIPIKELFGIRSTLRWAVWQERNPDKLGRQARITFPGPEMRP